MKVRTPKLTPLYHSVADPGCLSWILIFTHSGSRIQKQQQKRGGEKKFVILLFVATNFTKLKIILFLKCWRKTIGSIFKELLKFLPKKLSLSSQKYGFETKRHRIRDPVSRGQKDTGSRIRIRNTALSAEYHTVVVILRYTPEFTIFLVCLKNFILLCRCIAARNRTSVVFAAKQQQHGPTTTVISRPMLPGEYRTLSLVSFVPTFIFLNMMFYPSLSQLSGVTPVWCPFD